MVKMGLAGGVLVLCFNVVHVGFKNEVGSEPPLRWDKSEIHTNQKYISHFLMTGPGTEGGRHWPIEEQTEGF